MKQATWRSEKWSKDVPGPVMAETLDNIQNDAKKPPTLAEAVKEAQYVLGLYREGGTQAHAELAGEHGPDEQRLAKGEVRKCEAFIAKHSK